jgi:hypothetical protein
MKIPTIFLAACLIFLLFAENALADRELKEPDKAGKIAKAMIYRNDGETAYQKITLVTCRFADEGGKRKCVSRPVKKSIENIIMDLGENKRDTVGLGTILEPPSEKNMAFLQKDYDDKNREADQWMYFPAMKKLKRIVSQSPNSPKTGSVFGSEISYEDSERMQLNDYAWSYEGEDRVNGRACDVIMAYPTPARFPKTSYGYRKIWVDRESGFALKMEYYGKSKALEKTFYAKKIEKISGAWLARMEIMVNHKSGRMSMIRIDAAALNVEIDPALFDQRALEDASFREPALKQLRATAN